MNPLKQYIDLYRDNRDLICSKAPEPLNALRPRAAGALEAEGLPRFGSENYEVTDLAAWLAPDYGINVARVPLAVNPASTFHCGVPTLTPALFLMANDLWGETAQSRQNLPEGVEVCSLAGMARRDPEFVAKYYGAIASLKNPVVALNTMLAQDGFCLRVRRGVRLEAPLQLVNILSSSIPLMAVRRLLIVIEEDAEAKLLVCDHTQSPDTDLFSLQTIEIFAGRNASFDLYDLEESSERTTRLSSLYLRQEEGSRVTVDAVTLFNGRTRNEYHTAFRGPHAELRLYGMGIEDRSRLLDTYSCVDHAVGKCKTDELFKYVVDDNARGGFTGRIIVDPGAAGTEAFQANRNLVGAPSARMFAKPQLEIYNDDVKCSHGTAIGQLDPMQLFYMRTRGLSEATARLLLKQAFMSDVIAGVRIPALRDRLHLLVERRFAGASAASCSDCGSCVTPE